MATLHWMLPIQESPDQGGHSAKVTDETRLKALWVIRSGSLDPVAPVCYGRASNGERGRGKHEQNSVLMFEGKSTKFLRYIVPVAPSLNSSYGYDEN